MNYRKKRDFEYVDAILFDLDGTLVDTAPDFIAVVNELRLQLQLPRLEEFRIREQVSNGASAMAQLLSADTSTPLPIELLKAYKDQVLQTYEIYCGRFNKLFDQAGYFLEICDALKIPWGVVTNKPRHFTEIVIQSLDLQNRIGSVVCPEDVKHRKPDPESLFFACSELNVSPEKTIYVGDHVRDIEAGHAAGMKTVAATFGYVPISENSLDWKADYYIDNFSELCDLIFETK
ncbi:MAG: HAD-IA family hydrolase [Pseudomonadota bacterium]